MDVVKIRARVKEIISNITSIPVEEIADDASFREDLDLDSLSLMEVGVDVDYEFKLGLPEERMQELQTVQDTVNLVVSQQQKTAVEA
ncbi:MAG: acyl carrier protein [Acidobacteriota bacterium]|nr:acyl carrier protein [Acidobacteriota bacterium]